MGGKWNISVVCIRSLRLSHLGAFIVDSVGYRSAPQPELLIEAETEISNGGALLALLAASRQQFPALADVRLWYSEHAARSDHQAFALEGAPSVLTREAALNPCYHSGCDNLSYIDARTMVAAGDRDCRRHLGRCKAAATVSTHECFV